MRNILRPYIAVIADSFHEALATRVLWLILLLVAVLLAALAPFTFRDAVAVHVRFEDFRDARGVLLHLREHADTPGTPPGYLWSRLSESLQSDLAGLSVDSGRRERLEVFSRLRAEFNALLQEPDLYREEVWSGHRLNREGRDLLRRGITNLNHVELRRFNRLCLDAALPEFLEPAASDAVQFEYAGYALGDELPLQARQVRQAAAQVLAFIVSWLVGFAGVLAAIIVTASIIPRMLESGSIDLLLSKPVSRSGLFLSRFAGGCAFILLVTTVLISGLWLIAGTRLGIWNAGLLWTIPVFVFVFAVYFSVSALAGILWRNSIVSIIVSLVFWITCFGVGLIRGIVEDMFLDARRPAVLLPLPDSLLIVNRQGTGYEWDPREMSWQTLFENPRRRPGANYPYTGPVYDPAGDRLVAIRHSSGGPPWLREGPRLAIATRDSDWKFSTPVRVPGGSEALIVLSDGSILTAGTGGLFELAPSRPGSGLLDMLARAMPVLSTEDPEIGRFRLIDTGDFSWRNPLSAASLTVPVPTDREVESGREVETEPEAETDREADPAASADDTSADQPSGNQQPSNRAERFAVVADTRLAVLVRNGRGDVRIERQADRDTSVPAVIGFTTGRILLAEEGGTVRLVDAQDLSTIQTARPFGRNDPHSIAVAPDGSRAAIVFHHRRLCLVDPVTGQITVPPLDSQGDISAAAFGTDGSLLVAHGFGHVSEYSAGPSLELKARYTTPPDLLESIYRWGIRPVHRVFPKPGEMDSLVTWLMTREQTVPAGNSDSLTAHRTVIDIWSPLWSNLAFLTCMLLLSCVLISRRDF